MLRAEAGDVARALVLFLGRSRWGRRRGLGIGRAETPQWTQSVMPPLGMWPVGWYSVKRAGGQCPEPREGSSGDVDSGQFVCA